MVGNKPAPGATGNLRKHANVPKAQAGLALSAGEKVTLHNEILDDGISLRQ